MIESLLFYLLNRRKVVESLTLFQFQIFQFEYQAGKNTLSASQEHRL